MGTYGSGVYGAGVYGTQTLIEASGDGKLFGRYPSDRRGVLLKASFPEVTLQNHTFESTTESFAAVGTGTLSRNTTAPLSGTGDLKLAWTTGTGTRGVSRTYTGGSIITGPKLIRIQFTIRTDDPLTIIPTPASQEDYWSLRVKIYDTAGKVYKQVIMPRPGANTTRTSWYADFQIVAGKQISKFEILLDNTTTNKNLWLDNVKVIERAPLKIRFRRVTDGGYVRGGDPANAVQGVAYAFDDELMPGQLTEWVAAPIYDEEWTSGSPTYVGPETLPVSFTVDDRSISQPSHLVKSVETPGLTLYLPTDQKTISKSRQASFVNKQTTGKPAGGVTSAYSMSGDYQLITTSIADKNVLETILDELVLYIAPPGRYNRKPFYATSISYKTDDFARMDSPEKIFTITFQEVERPDTFGQPNYVPLRDYAWAADEFTTYADTDLTSKTYDQLAFTSVT